MAVSIAPEADPHQSPCKWLVPLQVRDLHGPRPLPFQKNQAQPGPAQPVFTWARPGYARQAEDGPSPARHVFLLL